MVNVVTINPPGAGVANIAFVRHEVRAGDDYDIYQLTATPNAGWRFVRFEWNGTVTETDPQRVTPYSGGSNLNPTDTNLNIQNIDSVLHERVIHWSWGDARLAITSVVAVFESLVPPVDTFKVSTSVVPRNAGTATGAGVYNSGSVCTIDAIAKCSPWVFDHWTVDGVVASRDAQYAFVVTKDVVCVAYFTHSDTDLILCQSEDGKILCSAAGKILYDGDQV